MDEVEELRYWFGFRQISPPPPGAAVACGPYSTWDEAVKRREKMKARDAALSEPFTADTAEDARNIAEAITNPPVLPLKQL